MKKYFIALLFGISLMSMQTASAATLMITDLAPELSATLTGSGSIFNGTTSTGGQWEILVSDLGIGEIAELLFTSIGNGEAPFFGFLPSSSGLVNGDTAFLTVIGLLSFRLDAEITSISEVPVPAAVWLFGSALAGLMGVSRLNHNQRLRRKNFLLYTAKGGFCPPF